MRDKESSVLKRVIVISILVLSVVFFIAGLAALLTIWIGNQPLTENLLARLDAIDTDLAAAETAFVDTRLELEATQQQIDLIQSVIASLGIDSQENVKILTDIVQSFDATLSPLIDTVSSGVGKLSEAFLALKNIVERLNALPLVSIEIPGAEKLEELSTSIQEQQAAVLQLKEKVQQISQLTEDTLNTLTSGYAEFEITINNLHSLVQEYELKIVDYRGQVATLEANIPVWIDQASVVLTIFLLWFLVAQTGLFLLAWSFYPGKDLLARWR
jgi:methyl-accepting chemotaxis protein